MERHIGHFGSSLPKPAEPGCKRKHEGNVCQLPYSGLAPDSKLADRWSVSDVLSYLQSLGLGHVGPAFQENGVDGQMLCELSEVDLVQNLGLKPLQAKKVIQRLWA